MIKKLFLLVCFVVWLTACGGADADTGGENPLSDERPFAVAILEVQTATEYLGDGGEIQTAQPGRQFALIKVATEAFTNFSPGDLAFSAVNGNEPYHEAWGHAEKLRYDAGQTNQYGNSLGNGWLVYDIPEGVTTFELIISAPDFNRIMGEYDRRVIELD